MAAFHRPCSHRKNTREHSEKSVNDVRGVPGGSCFFRTVKPIGLPYGSLWGGRSVEIESFSGGCGTATAFGREVGLNNEAMSDHGEQHSEGEGSDGSRAFGDPGCAQYSPGGPCRTRRRGR